MKNVHLKTRPDRFHSFGLLHTWRSKASALGLACLTVLMAACGHHDADKSAGIETQRTRVRIAPVQFEDVNNPVRAVGVLGSEREARLSFKTGGIVQKILVKEGDHVRPGQLLATLNTTEIDAQVAQAEEAVAKSERDQRRVRNLQADSAATLEQLQNAGTGLEVAKKNLEIARFNRSFSEIHSPIGGRVVRKLLNEGELAGPGMPVLVVLGDGAEDWVLNVGLADRDWARVHLGDRAEVVLDAYPGEKFSGTVTFSTDVADPTNGTFKVEIRLKMGGKKAAAGLTGQAQIFPQSAGAKPVIPIEALVESEGQSAKVFVVGPDGRAHAKQVVIAFLAENRVVLASGFEGMAAVVTDGAPYLKEGQLVEVVP